MATYGMSISGIQTAIADALDWKQNDAATLLKINQAIMTAGHAACTWQGRDWWFLDDTGHFQTATKTVAAVADSGAARASNAVTITTTAMHGLQIGQIVKISDVVDSSGDDAEFDGTFEVATVPSTTTFTYGQVGDTVEAAAAGAGTVYVASYPLRTITIAGAVTSTDASKVMPNLRATKRVYYDDDWALTPATWSQYRANQRILQTTATTKPTSYCVHGEPPYIYFWNIPAAAYDIHIDYTKRHAMPALDSDLLIPGEFHWDIYLNGALWLLRNKVVDAAALEESSQFRMAVSRMASSAPQGYDTASTVDNFADSRGGTTSPSQRILSGDGWANFLNTPTIDGVDP